MSTPINTLTPSQNAIDGALMLDLALEIDPSAAPATLDSSDSPLPLTPTVDDAAAQAYVLGTDGNDVLSGTAGDDIVLCAGGSDTVLAWTGNDTITAGTAGHNYIDAGAGDDTIYGALAGNDKLIGGADNDVIIAGGESNTSSTLEGDAGNDQLWGSLGNDFLYGGDDADTLDGWFGDDTLDGGAGADIIHGGAGNDTIVIHANDVPFGEIIDGGQDFDRLVVSDNNNTPGATFVSMEELYLNSGVTNLFIGYEQFEENFNTITHQDGSGAAFSITGRLAGTYSLEGRTITGILTLNGSSGDDTLNMMSQAVPLHASDFIL